MKRTVGMGARHELLIAEPARFNPSGSIEVVRTLLPVAVPLVLLLVLYARISDLAIAYHGFPSLAQPLVFLLAAVTVIRRAARNGSRILEHPAPLLISLLYLAVILGSAVWSPDSHGAVAQAVELAKNLLIVYVIVETFDTPATFRLVVWTVLVAGSGLAALTVLQAGLHDYSNTFWGLAQAPVRAISTGVLSERSSGPIGDPNFYGIVLAVLVPLALFRIRDESQLIVRAIAAACVAFLLAAIVLTYSRGALVALIVLLVIFLPLARVRLRYLGIGLVLLALCTPLIPSSYWSRASALLGSVDTPAGNNADLAIQKRFGSDEVALTMFLDNPLGGVGAGGYQLAYEPYARRLSVPNAAQVPHDLYLEVAAETGLIGLLSFLAAMHAVLLTGWRARAAARMAGDVPLEGLTVSCVLAVITYLVGSLFLPYAYPRYLWILVGLVLASYAATHPDRVSRQESSPRREEPV